MGSFFLSPDAMNFTTRYLVTRNIQEALARQVYAYELRSRVPKLALALLGSICPLFLLTGDARIWYGRFLLVSAATLMTIWIKAYQMAKAQAVASLSLLEHPKVTITLNDSSIEYESSTGTRRYRWDKISRVQETKDFIVVTAHDVALLGLPKSCLTPEALAYIRSHDSPSKGLKRPNRQA
jgi:hypothetical protein